MTQAIRSSNRFLSALLALAAVFFSHAAMAQQGGPWLQDRRYGEGNGFQMGALQLHGGVSAEGGYDSNFFRASGDEPEWGVSEPIVPTLRFQLTPAIRFNNLSRRADPTEQPLPPKVLVEGRALGQFNQLVALDDRYSDRVSQRSFLGAEGALVVDILPARPWGATLSGDVARIAQPNNLPEYAPLNRTVSEGALMLKWRPGGGILEWGLGYSAQLTVFDSPQFGLNRLSHSLQMQGRFRFLPRTSLLYQGELGFNEYLQPGTRQVGSKPVSSQLGINGLITERFGLLVLGGWKGMFYESRPNGSRDDFEGAVGRAEATWYLGGAPDKNEGGRNLVGLSTIRVGALRDVQVSGLGNYYDLFRPYAEVAYFIAGVASVTAGGGLSFVKHPPPRNAQGAPMTPDGSGVDELRPDVSLRGEYRLLKTLSLTAGVDYSASLNDNRLTLGRRPTRRDNLRFSRVTSLVGVRWFN